MSLTYTLYVYNFLSEGGDRGGGRGAEGEGQRERERERERGIW